MFRAAAPDPGVLDWMTNEALRGNAAGLPSRGAGRAAAYKVTPEAAASSRSKR